MSSHPGSTLKEAIELAEYLRDLGYMPEQVQDFYPTPSTISTCMYYTGVDPSTMKKVYVPVNPHEKAMQRALIQYRNPKNYDLVHEALIKAGRNDLIGFEKECLIRPRKNYGSSSMKYKKNSTKIASENTSKNGNMGKSRNTDKSGNTGKNSNFGKKSDKKKTIRNVHKQSKKK